MAASQTHRPSLGALGAREAGGAWVPRLRFAAALAVVALAAEVVYIALASPRFAVREIVLRGDPRIAEQAAPRVQLPANTNTIRAPMRLLAEQVETVPAVEKAYVARDLRRRLVVTMERREAVAVIRGAEGATLVDPQGVPFTIRDEWGWGLPELSGPHLTEGDARGGEAQAEIASLLTVLRALGPDPRLRLTRLEFRGDTDIEVILCSGPKVQLGSATQLETKVKLLAAALEQLGADAIEHMNLSDPRATYWRPRDETVSAQVR